MFFCGAMPSSSPNMLTNGAGGCGGTSSDSVSSSDMLGAVVGFSRALAADIAPAFVTAAGTASSTVVSCATWTLLYVVVACAGPELNSELTVEHPLIASTAANAAAPIRKPLV